MGELFKWDRHSFNVADSSSFARTIEESMRFTKQNPFQSYKALSCKRLSGEFLDHAYRSTEQFAALILAQYIEQLAISDSTLNTRPSSVYLDAHCTRQCSGGVSAAPLRRVADAHSTRSWSGQHLAPRPTLQSRKQWRWARRLEKLGTGKAMNLEGIKL